jgi:3-methyladenine DNA glycosylase AlkD
VKYSTKQAGELTQEAIGKFEQDDQKGFFQILDTLTRSRSGFAILRKFGAEVGKVALTDPQKYFNLFEMIMHRDREASYDKAILTEYMMKYEANLNALVYGGRTAIVGSAMNEMSAEHWQRIVQIIERYLQEYQVWYVADSFCHYPMGKIIADHPGQMLDILAKWSKSQNMWFRREVAVYLHAYFAWYPGREISAFMKLLEHLRHDPVYEVKSGIGWCLREMHKNYPQIMEDFVLRWASEADAHARKVIGKYTLKRIGDDKRELIRNILSSGSESGSLP